MQDARHRVLLVDPDPDTVLMLRNALPAEAYEVHVCASLAEATELAEDAPVDVVLLGPDAPVPASRALRHAIVIRLGAGATREERRAALAALRRHVFVRGLPARADELLAAWELAAAGDVGSWDELRLVAHRLAGAAATFGFDALADRARRLEGVVLANGTTAAGAHDRLEVLLRCIAETAAQKS